MSRDGLYTDAVLDGRSAAPVIELQSFRGFAALLVVFYHCALYYDYGAAAKSSMSLIFNAHGAVVSFFVLSGFVLTLSLMRARMTAKALLIFYVRRGFRIYPALWAGCLLGLAYLLVFGSAGTALGTEWARINCGLWPASPAGIALAFAGLKPNLPLPIWSLAVELVASALLPLMIFLMSRSLRGFALLSAGLAGVALLGGDRPLLVPTYLVDFAIGATLALIAPQLRVLLSYRNPVIVFTFGGLALLWAARVLTGADYEAAYHDPATGLIEGVGAALLIGAIYVRPDRFRPLSAPWATRLGDVSYSLYLLHQPVLSLVAALAALLMPAFVMAHPVLMTVLLIGATLGVSLPLANLSYTRVEVPAIGAGQRFVARIGTWLALRKSSEVTLPTQQMSQNLRDGAAISR